MNCHEFSDIIVDLLRPAALSPEVEAQAIAHMQDCPTCRARASGEQGLSSSLQIYALSTRKCGAPPHIEDKLLAAFRAQTRDRAERRSIPTRKILLPNFWRLSWFQGAAVTAALSIAITIYLFAATDTNKHPSLTTQSAQSQSSNLTHSMVISEPAYSDSLLTTETFPVSGAASIAAISGRNQQDAVVRRARNRITRKPPTIANSGTLSASDGEGGEHSSAAAATDGREIATEFLPLMDSNALSSMEGGQVVRVELPRTALVSLGLLMNAEQANEPVTADVLVGGDGLARAIRFVR